VVEIVEEFGSATTTTATATAATDTSVGKKYTKALLYRGTPDNPAFWRRVLFDLPLAAGECAFIMM
jgi:hypothetical protein